MEPADEALLRDYAAGRVHWRSLQDRFGTYLQVLAGLGELGLHPPMAPLEGPNKEGRERGRKMLRDRLFDAA